MTILILFQTSGYRTFKGFYTPQVQTQLRAEFPQLVSYTRFVALIPRVVLPMATISRRNWGTVPASALSTPLRSPFATPLASRSIAQHRVFRVDARRGKTSVGWFYGFKLHLVVNDCGELLAFCLCWSHSGQRR